MRNKIYALTLISISVVIVILAAFSWQKITTEVIKENSEMTGKKFVSRIIDGDTIVVEGESIRLLGIDASEKGEKCYKEAKARLEELILMKEVTLERNGDNKDQYDRYLRYIFLGEENINLLLVEEGLAIARFLQDDKYKEEIVEAEKFARENKIGCLWQNSQITSN